MPKLDLDAIPQTNATGYPPAYADVVKERWYRRLSPVLGLTDFGASHVVLKPGAWSAQRVRAAATLVSGDVEAARLPVGVGDQRVEVRGRVLLHRASPR